MNSAPSVQNRRPPSQWPARIVLLLALAVTAFAWWRERELLRRDDIIRFQDGMSRMNAVIGPLLGSRFEGLRDAARATLRQQGATASAWEKFLELSEWREKFPG